MTGHKRFVALVLALLLASSSAVSMASAVAVNGDTSYATESAITEADVGAVKVLLDKSTSTLDSSNGDFVKKLTIQWQKVASSSARYEVWRYKGNAMSNPSSSSIKYTQIADALSDAKYDDISDLADSTTYTYCIKPYIPQKDGTRVYGTPDYIALYTQGSPLNATLVEGSVARSTSSGKPYGTIIWDTPSYSVIRYDIYIDGVKLVRDKTYSDVNIFKTSTSAEDLAKQIAAVQGISDAVRTELTNGTKTACNIFFPDSGVHTVKVVPILRVSEGKDADNNALYKYISGVTYANTYTVTASPVAVNLSDSGSSPTIFSARNCIKCKLSDFGVSANAVDSKNIIWEISRATMTNGKPSAYIVISTSMVKGSTNYYYYDDDVTEGAVYSYKVVAKVRNSDNNVVTSSGVSGIVEVTTSAMRGVTSSITPTTSTKKSTVVLKWLKMNTMTDEELGTDKKVNVSHVKVERATVGSNGAVSAYEVLKEDFSALRTVKDSNGNEYYVFNDTTAQGNVVYKYRLTPIYKGELLKPVELSTTAKPLVPNPSDINATSKARRLRALKTIARADGKVDVQITMPKHTSTDLFELTLSYMEGTSKKSLKYYMHIITENGVETIKVTKTQDPSSEVLTDCTATKDADGRYVLTFTKGFTVNSDADNNNITLKIAPVNWYKVNGVSNYAQTYKVYSSQYVITYDSDYYGNRLQLTAVE